MSQNSIKNVCCTCLSTDRNVSQLCKILDGINLLYMLLSLDAEAYKQGFYKEPSSLLICWECAANVNKLKKFRKQVCTAQKLLTSLNEDRNIKLQSLSCLKIFHTTSIEQINYTSPSPEENFIDCGSILKEIKTESDDDIPVSIFCKNSNIDNEYINTAADNDDFNENDFGNESLSSFDEKKNLVSIDLILQSERNKGINDALLFQEVLDMDDRNVTTEKDLKKHKLSSEDFCFIPNKAEIFSKNTINMESEKPTKELDSNNPSENENSYNKVKTLKKKSKFSKYFSIRTMTEEEMLKNVEKRKIDVEKDEHKCDKCLISFKTKEEVFKHNERLHVKQTNLSEDLSTQTQSTCTVYVCVLCKHATQTRTDIVRHLKREHYEICCKKKKDSKQRKKLSFEVKTYPCSECELIFRNKDLRWKHVQKAHREGFQCTTCSKKFAFKSNLERHQRSHGPLSRRECPTCHKAVRVDLWSSHARTHTRRHTHTCVECDKVFASQATYHSHLKYALAHATQDVRGHACELCPKRYRSLGELKDHMTYIHEGRAQHQCPVCSKGLATKRCVRRHIRRAHEGIKENAKDKVCQVCGRTFRDKKTLLEHERVHSGARPLKCDVCGRAFRQRAALHKHTQRLHTNKLCT